MKYDFPEELKIEFISCNKNTYKDLDGCEKSELIMIFKSVNKVFSNKIAIFSNPYFLFAYSDTIKIRIPLYYGELKRFFPNYKDYFYLPLEDMCILKSVGSSVDINHRENAKKETCYVKHSGFFIPGAKPGLNEYKQEYNSKITYTEYNPSNATPEEYTEYAYDIIRKLNN